MDVRNRLRGGWVVGLGMLGLLMPVGRAEALSPPSRHDLMLRKLGRGLANIATCPGELIRVPMLVGRREGTVAGLSVGIIQGIWRVVLRGSAGVIETGTFFVGMPHGDFSPLITPEFLYAHGEFTE